jgi:hypothetical protein
MLSLLKKKSDADAPLAQPVWHPNFRNYKKLPDVKAVRTAFFVNGVAILVTVALGAFLGFREYQLNGVNAQIAEAQAQIDRDKKVSDQAVALFKKFQAEETEVLEVETFVKSKPIISTLLIRLGETVPSNVALDNIDIRDAGMTLRLSVRGDSAAAGGYADAYMEQLRTDKQLDDFDQVTFTGTPARNSATGKMAVEFFLRRKPATGGKK